ncbi:MAG: nuclear transport factor 2 family protein [Cyanobacteria bacterium P01_H01_bin.119]
MDIHSENQITLLEERLRQAMLSSDVAELEVLIAPELIFTNYAGQLVSKQEDLDMHRSGILKLTTLEPSTPRYQKHPGVSVVSVQMHLIGHYGDAPIDQQMRFTRVWATSSEGRIQVVAGHASLISEI